MCGCAATQDSTALWEALPAAVMSEAVRLHHTCVRKLLLSHKGYESATEVGLQVTEVLGTGINEKGNACGAETYAAAWSPRPDDQVPGLPVSTRFAFSDPTRPETPRAAPVVANIALQLDSLPLPPGRLVHPGVPHGQAGGGLRHGPTGGCRTLPCHIWSLQRFNISRTPGNDFSRDRPDPWVLP